MNIDESSQAPTGDTGTKSCTVCLSHQISIIPLKYKWRIIWVKSQNQRITEIYHSRKLMSVKSWMSVYRKSTYTKLNFQWQYFVTFTTGSWFLWN